MEEKLLKLEEVAILVGRSCITINSWYKWKRENPDHKFAYLLPDYIQSSDRQTRYWKLTDIEKLIRFKDRVRVGRDGFMGDVTQRYTKKAKEKKEDEKED